MNKNWGEHSVWKKKIYKVNAVEKKSTISV